MDADICEVATANDTLISNGENDTLEEGWETTLSMSRNRVPRDCISTRRWTRYVSVASTSAASVS